MVNHSIPSQEQAIFLCLLLNIRQYFYLSLNSRLYLFISSLTSWFISSSLLNSRKYLFISYSTLGNISLNLPQAQILYLYLFLTSGMISIAYSTAVNISFPLILNIMPYLFNSSSIADFIVLSLPQHLAISLPLLSSRQYTFTFLIQYHTLTL